MRVTRQHAQGLTLEEIREFVAASGGLTLAGADREEIYGFVEGTWQARQYLALVQPAAAQHTEGGVAALGADKAAGPMQPGGFALHGRLSFAETPTFRPPVA